MYCVMSVIWLQCSLLSSAVYLCLSEIELFDAKSECWVSKVFADRLESPALPCSDIIDSKWEK